MFTGLEICKSATRTGTGGFRGRTTVALGGNTTVYVSINRVMQKMLNDMNLLKGKEA